MIRINLLPTRSTKKKETAVQQVVVSSVSFGLVALLALGVYGFYLGRIASTRDEVATSKQKIDELKKKIGKLEEIKTLKAQVQKKLDVLTQLRSNKTGPAQRLAALSDNTPEQLWLTAYSESGVDAKISGIAYTEDQIASFMRSLETSSDFSGVELGVSEQLLSGNTKLKKFDLAAKLERLIPAQPEAAPKK